MKKTKPKKLLTVLLTLYLALSIVPITAYAGVTDVTGGTTTNTYSHFYHTKVETTAQVIIKDADGNVAETTEVTKSGDFVEGNVSSDAVQAEIKRIDDEIIAQFSSRGNITTENRNSTLMFDHFESSNIITGDSILVGDLDALEKAASGSSVNKNLVVHEYQVYHITYDLIVQENNDLEEDQVITKVDVGNIWKELDSAKPVVFTGEVNPNSYCVNQMTLTEEIWYTADKFNGGSGDEITSSNPRNPIAGEEYRYRITLTAKDGYFFHAAFRYHGEGGATLICENQNMSMDMWTGVLSADQKQLTIYFDNIKTTAIDGGSQDETTINNAYIRNVKFAYRSGDAPQATAEVLVDPLFEEYEIAYECWEEMENGEPVAFWYSDESKYTPSMKKITQFEEGKTYMYSIELREKNGYTFADNCSVTINGNPISATANAVKTVDGLFIMNVDTINPKPAFKEIPVVEINNATLTFKDGDKPVFTGTTPDDAPYVLVFEEWRTDGEWTRSDEWFNNADHHGNDKDITAFDKNKSYNYTFYIKTNDKAYEEGWCFGQNTKLKINGKEVSLSRADDNEGQFSGATEIIMTPTAEISVVEINNATLSYNPGDAPRATATVSDADQGKYRITDECWLELNENDVPVAIWHSNDEIYSTAPTITAFESGKKYVYSIQLLPERNYDFGREVAATVNGSTVTAVPGTDGYLILPNVTTMIPTESDKPATIDLIEINDVTVSFKDGDKPVFTGTVPENDQYAFRCEWWSLDENTGIVSTEPEWGGGIYKNKITAFEAGKTYHYGVYVTAYTADISPDAKLKINGREVKYTRIGDESDTQSFWVETDLTMTPAADGHTHKYGTEWKYDETNHWHECECGNKADITAHTFKQIIDKEATATEKGSKHEECTVCGYKKAAVDIPVTDFEKSSDDQPNKPINNASSEISSADQTNKPINTASPKTGNTDYMILWIVLLVAGGGVFITATAVDRKKK